MSAKPAPFRALRRPVLIFDGDCGFCTGAVLWALPRLRRPVDLEPWQRLAEEGRLARYRLSRKEARRWAWWVEDGRRWRGHRAVGRTLLCCRGAWPVAGALLLVPPPLSWPFALGYFTVSHLRRWLPGVRPACKREHWPS